MDFDDEFFWGCMKSILILFTFFVTGAAAESSKVIKINSVKSELKPVSKFSHSLNLTLHTNLEKKESSKKAYSAQVSYGGNYKLSSLYSIFLSLKVGKNLRIVEESKVQNTKLGFSRKGRVLSKDVKWSPSISFVLPTSKKSKEITKLKGGIEVNNSFQYNANKLIQFSYTLRLVREFHKYKTTKNYKTNSEYKTFQFFVGRLSLSESFYFESALIYANSWSYEGTRRDPSYLTNLELSYRWAKGISTSFGATQGGSLTNIERGRDKSISVFDRNETTVYTTFGVIF